MSAAATTIIVTLGVLLAIGVAATVFLYVKMKDDSK